MINEFTRLEFEGGCVVVVKTDDTALNHTVLGNNLSEWEKEGSLKNMTHDEAVSEVMCSIGSRVKRRLFHRVSPE